MESLINIFTVFLLFCVNFNNGESEKNTEYRFDYQWNEQTESWMKYHVIPATWDEARLRCHAEGAILASPLNNELKQAVLYFVNTQKKRETFAAIWTGVHATFSKGDYTSVEGVPLSRLSVTWSDGEPDNYQNSESCLCMTTGAGGLMADTRCDSVLPYVCYKPYTKLTFNECGTYDSGYVLEPKTGSCYKYHGIGRIWSEAFMTCLAEGGHLAVIDNSEEADVIKNIIYKYSWSTITGSSREIANVGFHDWGHFGSNFMTIHGESLDVKYDGWSNTEPNNGTSLRTGDAGEFCGAVWKNGKLIDILCHTPVPYICEMKPNSLRTPNTREISSLISNTKQ